MVAYSSAVSINRPASQIYPYLLESTVHGLGPNLPATKVPSGPLANGARIDVSFGFGPVKTVIGLQISDMDFGRKLAFKSYSGPISWKGEYTLADDGKGSTTVSQKGELVFTGLWRLWQPIGGGQIRRSEEYELRRLKKLIEATPALAS